MNIYKIDSVASATQACVSLSKTLPFKQSKTRELLAQSLGYKSYNGLLGHIKERPVLFSMDLLIDDLAKNYHYLTKRPPASTTKEIESAFDGMKLMPTIKSGQSGFYEIEFETIGLSGDCIPSGEPLADLKGALHDVGILSDEARYNEDEPCVFISSSYQDLLSRYDTLLRDPSNYPAFTEFFTSLCEDIGVTEHSYSLSTGIHALYIASTSPESIPTVDMEATYTILQESSGYEGEVFNDGEYEEPITHYVKIISVRFCPFDGGSTNLGSGTCHLVPALKSANPELDNLDLDNLDLGNATLDFNGSRRVQLSGGVELHKQFTKRRLDNLVPRNGDVLYGSQDNLGSTLSAYLVNTEEWACIPVGDDACTDHPHPSSKWLNIYLLDNTLHLEHADYLSIAQTMNCPSRFFDSLGKLHDFLSDYAKEKGYSFTSHYMTLVHNVEIPKLAIGNGFYLTPIDYSFSEVDAVERQFQNDLKNSTNRVDVTNNIIELGIKCVKDLEHRYADQRCFVDGLIEAGVQSMSIAELSDPDTGSLMSATFTAYGDNNYLLGSFMMYSIHGDSDGYRNLRELLNDSLLGGCHVVVRHESNPKFHHTSLAFGWSDDDLSSMYVVNEAPAYNPSDECRPLLVTFNVDDELESHNLLGATLGDDVLGAVMEGVPELAGKQLFASPVLPMRQGLSNRCVREVVASFGANGLLGSLMTDVEWQDKFSKSYMEHLRYTESKFVIDDRYQQWDTIERAGVIVFTSLTVQELVDVAFKHAKHFNTSIYSVVTGSHSLELSKFVEESCVRSASVEQTITREDVTKFAGLRFD